MHDEQQQHSNISWELIANKKNFQNEISFFSKHKLR